MISEKILSATLQGFAMTISYVKDKGVIKMMLMKQDIDGMVINLVKDFGTNILIDENQFDAVVIPAINGIGDYLIKRHNADIAMCQHDPIEHTELITGLKVIACKNCMYKTYPPEPNNKVVSNEVKGNQQYIKLDLN